MTDASADELKISGIIHVGKPGSGLFKATVALVGWKNTVSGLPDNTLSLSGGDIVSAEWQRACGKGRCLLKLCFAGGDGSVSRFAGFKEQELSAVKAHLQRHFKVALSEPNVATEGWCWGDILPYQEEATTSNNPDLRVMINGKLGFDVPVCELHQVSTPSKTDLNLEFKQDPAALSSGNEILTEMRLFIPGVDSASCAENLREELLKRSGLTKVEEALLSLPQVSIVAPRGKYDVQFLPKALRIHGKTMTHTVRYDAIVRLFLLDISATLPSGMTTAIAVGLSPPMRQGKTDHYWLVLGFDESTMSVDSLSDGIIKRINIAREDHKVSSLMGKALAVFSGKTVVGTSSDFKNLHPQKHACLTVTYKAQPGLLFFCKMSFILALKPVIYHKWQDVDKVIFNAGAMRGRSFDLIILLKGGQQLEFLQIDKNAFEATQATLEKLGVAMEGSEKVANADTRVEARQARATRRKDDAPSPPAAARATRSGAAKVAGKPGGGASRGAAVAKPKDDEYDEEEDEDFPSEDGGDDDDDGSSSSEGEEENDDVPAKKRPKRK
mmetsp:Transcript_135303/g.432565  ORF Transcript_135303/g.432565 Transcript_135303/m.432565 type:complete len:554 (-) Transcript_135303:239-1900(-)